MSQSRCFALHFTPMAWSPGREASCSEMSVGPLNCDKSPEFWRVFGRLSSTGHKLNCSSLPSPMCTCVTKRDWLYRQASWPLQQLLIQVKLIWNDFATPLAAQLALSGCITAHFSFLFFVSPWRCIYRLSLHVLPVVVWLSDILNSGTLQNSKEQKQQTEAEHSSEAQGQRTYWRGNEPNEHI